MDHDPYTGAVIAAINAEGTAYFSGTVWQGRRAMRISVVNLAHVRCRRARGGGGGRPGTSADRLHAVNCALFRLRNDDPPSPISALSGLELVELRRIELLTSAVRLQFMLLKERKTGLLDAHFLIN